MINKITICHSPSPREIYYPKPTIDKKLKVQQIKKEYKKKEIEKVKNE